MQSQTDSKASTTFFSVFTYIKQACWSWLQRDDTPENQSLNCYSQDDELSFERMSDDDTQENQSLDSAFLYEQQQLLQFSQQLQRQRQLLKPTKPNKTEDEKKADNLYIRMSLLARYDYHG